MDIINYNLYNKYIKGGCIYNVIRQSVPNRDNPRIETEFVGV